MSDKQIREAIQPNYSVSDPAFRTSITHLLGGPLVDGNDVVELVNGEQIFPPMLEAIRGAQKSITLETYVWCSGEISTQFVDALAERARAGIKVHVIVDTFGSFKLSKSDIRKMASAGVKFKRFNSPLIFRLSFLFKLFRMNERDHRKLLVVDGKVGFIGGVGLADDWLGNAEAPTRWRDTHFRVTGPVVGQMQAAFAENWLETHSEILHGPDYFPELRPAGKMTAQCFPSGAKDKSEQAKLCYLLSIAAAKSHIRLAHAYFLPSKLSVETMREARQRGVRIELLVPAKTDRMVVPYVSRAHWDELLDAGVEFYEYQPTLYHCKIMIVDGIWSSVGSVNFDEQSFRLNDEANLNVFSEEFAAKLIESFERDKSKSRRLTKDDL